MEYDVTIDRQEYIGGSDIPAIMGLSSFKTRWELLLEKAGLKEIDFTGNKYTVYGQKLEPQIRAYINLSMATDEQFIPNKTTQGNIRCHTDGFNGKCVLEIKTTSHIYDDVNEYKVYLVQLLKYMEVNGVEHGKLAVYARPDDFNTEFDEDRLKVHEIDAGVYKHLTEQINAEIKRFCEDLDRLKANPLLTEEDFQPNELVALSNKVMVLENRMAEYKAVETEYKAMKQALFEAMQKHDVKSWETFNGTKIARVDGTEAKTETVTEFDSEKFSQEHPRLFKKYSVEKTKRTNGRSGFVKITLPKVSM